VARRIKITQVVAATPRSTARNSLVWRHRTSPTWYRGLRQLRQSHGQPDRDGPTASPARGARFSCQPQ